MISCKFCLQTVTSSSNFAMIIGHVTSKASEDHEGCQWSKKKESRKSSKFHIVVTSWMHGRQRNVPFKDSDAPADLNTMKPSWQAFERERDGIVGAWACAREEWGGVSIPPPMHRNPFPSLRCRTHASCAKCNDKLYFSLPSPLCQPRPYSFSLKPWGRGCVVVGGTRKQTCCTILSRINSYFC